MSTINSSQAEEKPLCAEFVVETPKPPMIRPVLCGEMAARFGPLPIVPLPQDDEPLLGWIRDVADLLKDKGLFQRADVVVLPQQNRRRLIVMEAMVFCSWVQRHLMPSRIRYDRSGEAFLVYKDVPSDVAEKTLVSLDFVPEMPVIDKVMPAPLPVLDDEGKLSLMPEGYHAPTRTFTFPLFEGIRSAWSASWPR